MKTQKAHKGFTILEIVLSMAILAMLMVAVGAAFEASAKNYADNEDMYKMMNTGRQALFRITTDLRSAVGGQVEKVGAGVDDDEDNRQCTLARADGTPGGTYVTYHFNIDSAISYDAALENETLYQLRPSSLHLETADFGGGHQGKSWQRKRRVASP